MRRAFTLIELLVCLGIAGLLLALLIPAISLVRESARRADCSNRLRQLVLACHTYEGQYGVWPNGGLLRRQLLPHLDQTPVYERLVALGEPMFAPPSSESAALLAMQLPIYLCPSDAGTIVFGRSPSNYCGNFGTGVQRDGYNGMFTSVWDDSDTTLPERPIRTRDVTDGMSNTAAFSEILPQNGTFDRLRALWQLSTILVMPDELEEFAELCFGLPVEPRIANVAGNDSIQHGVPWTRGGPGYALYNHILPAQSPSCLSGGNFQRAIFSAGSLHAGGVNLTYADGHTGFLSKDVDRQVWQQIGSRVESAYFPLGD